MIKSSIKYTILCSVFLTGLFFVSLVFGSNPLLDPRHFFFDLAIFFLFIYFGGKEYKEVRNSGYLHFWQGISTGFVIFIPSVFIFSSILLVIFELNPILIEGYKEGAKAFLESQKEVFLKEYSEQQLQDQKNALDTITSWQLVLSTFGKKLFAGFLVTPVVAIILRRKPN